MPKRQLTSFRSNKLLRGVTLTLTCGALLAACGDRTLGPGDSGLEESTSEDGEDHGVEGGTVDPGELEPRALHDFKNCDDLREYAAENIRFLIGSDGEGWDEDDGGFSTGAAESGGGWEDDGGFDGDEGGWGGDEGGADPGPEPGGDTDNGGGGQGGGDGDPDHSDTNVQEEGVDEPDIIKTDGKRILVISGGVLHYIDTESNIEPSHQGSLELEPGWDYEILLHGDGATILFRTSAYELTERPSIWKNNYRNITGVMDINLSDPTNLEVEKVTYFGGDLVDARQVNNRTHLVLRSSPIGLEFKSWWDFYEYGGSDHTDSDGAEGWSEVSGGDPTATTGGWDEGSRGDDDWGEVEEGEVDWGEDFGDTVPPEEVDEGHVEGDTVPPEEVDESDVDGGEPEPQEAPERQWHSSKAKTYEEAAELAEAYNKAVIRASEPENWLPSYIEFSDGGSKIDLVYGCETTLRPGKFSGLDLVSVITLDPDPDHEGEDDPAYDGITGAGVFSTGETVYASTENLFVATRPYWPNDGWGTSTGTGGSEEPDGKAVDPEPERQHSFVHQFQLGAPSTYRASGQVDGYLLSQWSMSEFKGDLRVATTLEGNGRSEWGTESLVSVLRPNDAGELATIGYVDGLGLDERIYAVRFIGDIGYVVTFRETDPLYTIDLSEPSDPMVRGELKINGYSAYLHPLGDDLLLGVGQDATDEGWQTGSQLSLFDIADLDNPERIFQHNFAKIRPAMSNLITALSCGGLKENLVAVPLRSYEWRETENGYYERDGGSLELLRVDRENGFQPLASIHHPGERKEWSEEGGWEDDGGWDSDEGGWEDDGGEWGEDDGSTGGDTDGGAEPEPDPDGDVEPDPDNGGGWTEVYEWTPMMKRSVVIKDTIYSLSEEGIQVNHLDGIAELAWIELER